MSTPWAKDVNPDNVWPEYPRPIMERDRWANLNGQWDYAILPKGSAMPTEYDGKILVPFAVESELSGVGRKVGADNELWYSRSFNIPASWRGEDVLLNFGAVDWRCDVWVNNIKVGSHQGGYTPFSLNITDALAKKGPNTVTVRVFDPSDKGPQPRGKQVEEPKTIWYTPVTGIWQTVWLEPVPKQHIKSLKTTPDVDNRRLIVKADVPDSKGSIIKTDVYDNGRLVASGNALAGNEVEIDMPTDMKLWDTETPHLYDLEVSLSADGKTLDKVKSYAAMRKVSMGRDDKGVMRFRLNDKDIFHFGPLDQGWWPDGLYTAPTYEAMVYDVDKTTELGFNMIRKHVKVEPALWYTYCDRSGILVWQDMPNGDVQHSWQNKDYYRGEEYVRTPESDKIYRDEWRDIIDALYNYPCIVTWVPFNEGWGQYNTVATAEWTKAYDPTRLVNASSGGNFFDCGDILDIHHYPAPKIVLLSEGKANVIGEYGGIGYPVEGHLWAPDRNWGYVKFDSPQKVTDEYVRYIDILDGLAGSHYTGAVYTQTTDVEIEVNGLMTYDRKLIKVDPYRVRRANRALIEAHSSSKAPRTDTTKK